MYTRNPEPELPGVTLTILLASAETATEMRALMRIGVRTGLMWICPSCKNEHYTHTTETCCGKPRPDEDNS